MVTMNVSWLHNRSKCNMPIFTNIRTKLKFSCQHVTNFHSISMHSVFRFTLSGFYMHCTYAMLLYQYRIPDNSMTTDSTTHLVTNKTETFQTTITGIDTTTPAVTTTKPNISPWDGCSEEETPANIGPYEVPSQRDLILLTSQLLLRMFDKYHEKQLYFLKDIKEATKATAEVEKNCLSVQKMREYRHCVKKVSGYCEMLTKRLVTRLEHQRTEFVSDMQSGVVCNMAAMRTDPVALMNSLAVEQVSLEFALPGFLRLLNSCSSTCHKDLFLAKMMKQMGGELFTMRNQDNLARSILKNSFYKMSKRGI